MVIRLILVCKIQLGFGGGSECHIFFEQTYHMPSFIFLPLTARDLHQFPPLKMGSLARNGFKIWAKFAIEIDGVGRHLMSQQKTFPLPY